LWGEKLECDRALFSKRGRGEISDENGNEHRALGQLPKITTFCEEIAVLVESLLDMPPRQAGDSMRAWESRSRIPSRGKIRLSLGDIR
jgi:hypothetical protein